MSSKKKADAPPPHIAKTLPSDARIWEALKNSICELKAGTVIVRAAWNKKSVWPDQVGCALDRIIAKHADLDGIRYMSRKHLGHFAYAISSRAMDDLDSHRQTSIERFENTDEYLKLRQDSCFSKF